MTDRSWMYTGHKGKNDYSAEWMDKTNLTLDQYLKVRPWWAKKCPNAWRKLAELKWCNEDWKRKSCEGRERKERMTGPAHRQGSASITRYTRKMEREEKKSFSHIEAYTIARRIDPDGTTFSQSTKDKLEAYKDVVEAMHGPDFDWIKEPLDPVAVYKAGGGKKRGRFMLGDGFINTQEVLAEVRTLSSTTLDDIRPPRQRRTDPPAGTAIQQLRVEMEREHEAWRQELQREREARIQDREYFSSQIKLIQAENNANRQHHPNQQLETSESVAAAVAAGGQNHIGHCEDQVDESSPVQP